MLQNQGVAIVNGQLVSQAPAYAESPVGFSPYSSVGPSVPPTIPPSINTLGTNTPTVNNGVVDQSLTNALNNPLNPKHSPVVPVLVMLAISLFFLHVVHFRETVEGGE